MGDTENWKRAKYEPSTKGGTLLKDEAGSIYHFATRYGANEHWYCKERKNALVKCKAFARIKISYHTFQRVCGTINKAKRL